MVFEAIEKKPVRIEMGSVNWNEEPHIILSTKQGGKVMLYNNREGRGVRERTLACLVVLPMLFFLMSSAMVFSGRTALSETGIIEIASSHAREDFFEIHWHEMRIKSLDESEFRVLLDRVISLEFPWQNELPDHRVRYIEEQSLDAQQASIYRKTYISSIREISASFAREQREIRIEAEESEERRAIFSIIAVIGGIVIAVGILAVLFFIL